MLSTANCNWWKPSRRLKVNEYKKSWYTTAAITTGRTVPVETFAWNATVHRKSGASFDTGGCLQRARTPVRRLRSSPVTLHLHPQLPRLPSTSPSSSIAITSSSSLPRNYQHHGQLHPIHLRLLDGRPGSVRRTQTSRYHRRWWRYRGFTYPKVSHPQRTKHLRPKLTVCRRVMATQVAEMDDVRHKRQFLREDFSYDPSAIASSQYYDEPKVTHYLNVKDGSRFLFRRTYTSTVYSTLQVRILVTCAGVHPAAC